MKRILGSFIGLLFLGLLFSGTASGEEKYTLRYRFQPGEILRWNVEHRTAVRATMSGQTQTEETDSRSVKAWRGREVRPNGTAVLEHLVESIDMRQQLSGCEAMRYNSQTDKKPPAGFEDAAAAVGVPLTIVTLNPRGKIVERERKVVSTATPNGGEMTIPLPEKPIAIGEGWSQQSDIDLTLKSGGVKKIKAVQQFTLESVQTGVATIRLATHILTPLSNPEVESQVVQRESAGRIRFDLDAGRILSQQLDVDKHVVGFRGGASSLHYQMRFREELLPQPVQTAVKGRMKDEG
jgi:hypothetical protein